MRTAATTWVRLVENAADRLAGRSHDLFTLDDAWAREVAGHGLAAAVYLFVGHVVAGRLHRL